MTETSAPDAVTGAAAAESGRGVDDPLLSRLNARGFRLVQLLDAVGLYAAAVLIMWVRFGWEWRDYSRGLYLTSFAVTVAVFVASIYFGGLYEREPRLGMPAVLPRAARQTLAAGGIVALLTLAATGAARELGFTTQRALPMPIFNLAMLIVVGAVIVAVNRRLAIVVRRRREGPPRVLVAGLPDDLAVAQRHLPDRGPEAEIVGQTVDPSAVLSGVDRTDATDVVIVSAEILAELYPDVIAELTRRDVTVLYRVTAQETLFGLQRVREVGGMPFVLLHPQAIPASRVQLKRLTDLTMLLVLLPVVVPLLLAVSVYQALVAGRPLFYRQARVGKGGRVFEVVKFRTMGVEAEKDTGATLADRDDPRVIPACRWIRRARLDELPQFWNVLKGEMSLVGPRPERPELTERFARDIPGYDRRHELPPGITGLAQIHGRYHTDPEYKLGYDLQYLVNWSPVLDLEILARTVMVVLTGRE